MQDVKSLHLNNARIEALTGGSLRDPRLTLRHADAFVAIDTLLADKRRFDVIIVDLPDPSHPDLNRLYSVNFYARLKQLLYGDGAMVVQSTSPYHARNAFIAIGKTLKAAGFGQVQQYHANVPSFGEWGFSLAVPMGRPPLARLQDVPAQRFDHPWLNKDMALAAFAWPRHFYHGSDTIRVNTLGSHVLYQYHQQAWQDQQGLNNAVLDPMTAEHSP